MILTILICMAVFNVGFVLLRYRASKIKQRRRIPAEAYFHRRNEAMPVMGRWEPSAVRAARRVK